MSVAKHNRDRAVPWSETFQFSPVIPAIHLKIDQIPIFWGPGQYTLSYPDYTPPSMKAWHKQEPLSIPKVVRFIYATDSTYDTKGYPGAGPPPPPDIVYTITQSFRMDPPNAHQWRIIVTVFNHGSPSGTISYVDNMSGVINDLASQNPYPVGTSFVLVYPQVFPIGEQYDFNPSTGKFFFTGRWLAANLLPPHLPIEVFPQ